MMKPGKTQRVFITAKTVWRQTVKSWLHFQDRDRNMSIWVGTWLPISLKSARYSKKWTPCSQKMGKGPYQGLFIPNPHLPGWKKTLKKNNYKAPNMHSRLSGCSGLASINYYGLLDLRLISRPDIVLGN